MCSVTACSTSPRKRSASRSTNAWANSCRLPNSLYSVWRDTPAARATSAIDTCPHSRSPISSRMASSSVSRNSCRAAVG